MNIPGPINQLPGESDDAYCQRVANETGETVCLTKVKNGEMSKQVFNPTASTTPEESNIPPPAEAFLGQLAAHFLYSPRGQSSLDHANDFMRVARTLDEYVDERIRQALAKTSWI